MHMHSRQDTTITCWVYSKQHRLGQPHNTKFPNVLSETANVVCFFSAMPASVRLYSLDCCNFNLFLMIFVNIWDTEFFLLTSGLWRWISHIYEKGHLGGLLDLRSHGSAVSTACSNSLVSPSSCRTNREEEALKPHITTIRAASGAQRGRGSLHSGAWGTGVRGSQKREVGSPHPHILENFSPSHGVCSFCGFMQTGLQSQTVWSSPETWVLG